MREADVWQGIKARQRYLFVFIRLFIGALFGYAGIYKINHLAGFSEAIADYEMVPYWAVNTLAVLIPWIEIVCGILLLLGAYTHAAAIVIGGMLMSFSGAILVNLLSGSHISCGCFQTFEPITWKALGRDLLWLVMTACIFLGERPKQWVRDWKGK